MDLFRNSSLEQIQSVLSGYQQQHDPPTNTIHEWISKGRSTQRNPKTANWPIDLRVLGGRKKPLEHHQKFFGVFLSMKLRQTMTSKEWQGITIPSSVIHCSLGYIYNPFQTPCVHQVLVLAKHHTPFSQAASRKTPFCAFSKNILSHVCFSKNILS